MNNNLTDKIHSTVKLTPLKITLIYMLVGLFYILFSDQLIAVFVENLTTVVYLGTIKGCFYMLVTGLMLYALVGRSFSELYRSEERLRKSEKSFRDLVENSLTGISIIQDGQIVYQNQEQERFFGPLPRSSKLKDFKNIHPDDIEKVQKFNLDIFSDKMQVLDMDFRLYVPDKQTQVFRRLFRKEIAPRIKLDLIWAAQMR